MSAEDGATDNEKLVWNVPPPLREGERLGQRPTNATDRGEPKRQAITECVYSVPCFTKLEDSEIDAFWIKWKGKRTTTSKRQGKAKRR